MSSFAQAQLVGVLENHTVVLEVGYSQLPIGHAALLVSKAFSETLQCFAECFAHSKEQHAMFSVQLHATFAFKTQFTGIRIL